MKSSVLVIFGGLALACSAVTQEAKPPALLAKGKDGKSAPLRVDEVDVSVKVVGNVAETVLTLRFRNDTDRVLEGELVFPRGEGRTVSRYAMDVNGAMREGGVTGSRRTSAGTASKPWQAPPRSRRFSSRTGAGRRRSGRR